MFHMLELSPLYVLVDVFANDQLDWMSSNMFHKRKVSPQCVLVDVFANNQLGWMSSNMFHMRKVSLHCVSYYALLDGKGSGNISYNNHKIIISWFQQSWMFAVSSFLLESNTTFQIIILKCSPTTICIWRYLIRIDNHCIRATVINISSQPNRVLSVVQC